MNRATAYGILVHHALNTLWYQVQDEALNGCCLKCCAACSALHFLDKDGVLDATVRSWDQHADGSWVNYNDPAHAPAWMKAGRVDRDWLYAAWENGPKACHDPDAER